MHCRFVTTAFVAGLLALPGHAEARQPRMIDEIMADTNGFAAAIDTQLRRGDDQAKLRNVDNVVPDMVPSPAWRFHAQRGGLLVAIPVTRNLTATEKYGGEREIVDIVERLTRQRGFSGRIRVVFIEPVSLALPARSLCPVACSGAETPMACACH